MKKYDSLPFVFGSYVLTSPLWQVDLGEDILSYEAKATLEGEKQTCVLHQLSKSSSKQVTRVQEFLRLARSYDGVKECLDIGKLDGQYFFTQGCNEQELAQFKKPLIMPEPAKEIKEIKEVSVKKIEQIQKEEKGVDVHQKIVLEQGSVGIENTGSPVQLPKKIVEKSLDDQGSKEESLSSSIKRVEEKNRKQSITDAWSEPEKVPTGEKKTSSKQPQVTQNLENTSIKREKEEESQGLNQEKKTAPEKKVQVDPDKSSSLTQHSSEKINSKEREQKNKIEKQKSNEIFIETGESLQEQELYAGMGMDRRGRKIYEQPWFKVGSAIAVLLVGFGGALGVARLINSKPVDKLPPSIGIDSPTSPEKRIEPAASSPGLSSAPPSISTPEPAKNHEPPSLPTPSYLPSPVAYPANGTGKNGGREKGSATASPFAVSKPPQTNLPTAPPFSKEPGASVPVEAPSAVQPAAPTTPSVPAVPEVKILPKDEPKVEPPKPEEPKEPVPESPKREEPKEKDKDEKPKEEPPRKEREPEEPAKKPEESSSPKTE